MFQKWKYHWHHKLSGKSGESETLREMTPHQFLSALAWWNLEGRGNYIYFPDHKQFGILPRHQCNNLTLRD